MDALATTGPTGPETPESGFAPEAMGWLNALRLVAMRCRAAARLDLFRACTLLSHEPVEAGRAYAEALLRTLPQALGRAPVLRRPGCPELSTDEAWLLRCLERAAAGDLPSLDFLLSSRAARESRRPLGFLIGNLARRLDSF